MRNLLLTAAAVFGSIPGIAVMISGIATPPGYRWLFAGMIQFSGVLTLLLLYLNRGRLARIDRRVLTFWSIGLLAVAAAFLLVSVLIAVQCIVTSTRVEYREYGPVFFPIWTTGEIARHIDYAGSRTAVIDKYGPSPVTNDIAQMPMYGFAKWTTISVMLIVYQATFVALTIAIVLPAVVLKKTM